MNAQGNGWAKSEPENRVGWVFQGQYDNCEGKDSGNYTQIIVQTSDAQCTNSDVRTLGLLIVIL